MENEKILEVSGLTKRYKDILAVDNLSFDVYRGDVFGFLGPNGAGKSTTIRMMTTLIFPTSGRINIFGRPLLKNREYILSKIGAIVEKPDFYNYLSAYKNLEILGRISGGDAGKKNIMENLEIVGLAKRAHSKVKTFSHGMKQRLGIAQALLHNPELIILDEPTTGLDPQGMKDIRDLITRLSSEMGKTILLSSHILHEVEMAATRMIIINEGKKIVEGSVKELLSKSGIKVQFGVDSPENAEKALLDEFGGKIKTAVDEGALIVEAGEAEIPALNKILVESGIEVKSIIPLKSLEDYFISLTKGASA